MENVKVLSNIIVLPTTMNKRIRCYDNKVFKEVRQKVHVLILAFTLNERYFPCCLRMFIVESLCDSPLLTVLWQDSIYSFPYSCTYVRKYSKSRKICNLKLLPSEHFFMRTHCFKYLHARILIPFCVWNFKMHQSQQWYCAWVACFVAYWVPS